MDTNGVEEPLMDTGERALPRETVAHGNTCG